MSLSQKNLSSVQKAGQAVHDAAVAIAHVVRNQAQSMVSSLSSEPFGAQSEQIIARFKNLSSLSQGLAAIEIQLQKLYANASELASPVADVIVLPSLGKSKALTNAAAVDVVAKTVKAPKAKKVKRTKTGARKSAATGGLTANDRKLLSFLQSALKTNGSTVITGAAMAAGSGLPLGSVGVSLKKVISTGAVKSVGRGTYQLGASATEVVVVPTPAKKSKVSATVRAKAVKAAKPAKKTRARVKSAKAATAVAEAAAPAAPL